MDIKNVSDFFRRKGVNVMSEQSIFAFINASPDSSQNSLESSSLTKSLEFMFENRPTETDDDAEAEVAREVYRKQFIPQNLDQVYDIERDAKMVRGGKKEDLVYGHLLPDRGVPGSGNEADGEDTGEGGVSLDSASASQSDSDSDDEKRFAKGTPRGKKHISLEEKKVSWHPSILRPHMKPRLNVSCHMIHQNWGFHNARSPSTLKLKLIDTNSLPTGPQSQNQGGKA